MLRQSLTKWFLGLAVVAGMTALGSQTAEAHLFHHHWGSCGSSGGSWGSWGSCGGSSGGSWGSYGSCGSCGYAVVSYCCGSSGGSWGSSGGSSGGMYVPAPTAVPSGPTTPGTPAPPPPGASTYYYPDSNDTAYLRVSVPADARVFVNDRPTTSTGTERQYVSHNLEAGMRYEYTVRVEVVRDGKPLSDTRKVQLTAGGVENVAFSFDAPTAPIAKQGDSTRTAVLLHVPAESQVFLSGTEMKSTGSEREFATTHLAAGQQWDNYTIRVVYQGETKEQKLTIKAGEKREVSFDFPTHVAAATR